MARVSYPQRLVIGVGLTALLFLAVREWTQGWKRYAITLAIVGAMAYFGSRVDAGKVD
jgi:hypothetical protein